MNVLLRGLFVSAVLLTALTSIPNSVAQTGTSTSVVQPKKKSFRERLSFTYWSMFSGPGLGQSLDQSVDATGNAISTGANYFQLLFTNYEVNDNLIVGTQLRTSSDFRDDGFNALNPRVFARFKNIIDNKWLNLSLQPFVELPTTAVTRGRTLQTSLLFAQNWTFKAPDPALSLFLMTMTNANIYRNAFGHRTAEFIAMPMVGYQLSPKWQFLTWGWFDWAHIGGTPAGTLADWGDNYVRAGMNYFVTKDFQVYPCLQVYTDNIQASTTTLGLELSATL
jgi:hypothetical protein